MLDMTVSDESFVSTLLTVQIEDDGNVTQSLEMDTLHGMVNFVRIGWVRFC
jgi:hypothetical protein